MSLRRLDLFLSSGHTDKPFEDQFQTTLISTIKESILYVSYFL